MLKNCFLWLLIIVGLCSAQVNLENGLLAHYPFNGNAEDASLNGNHGLVHGALLSTDRFGNENSAYDFDGFSSYISVANSASLMSPTTSITMAAWVYLDGWSHVGSAFGPVLMKSNSSLNGFQYRFKLDSSGFSISLNNWSNGAGAISPVPFGEWHHVACTMDSGVASFYLDGAFIGTDPIAVPIVADSLPLEIGRDSPGFVEYFDGKIDEIRIYDRALNADEILALFGDESLPNPENLSITIVNGVVQLLWDAVPGAMSYKVYSSTDAYAIVNEDSGGTFVNASWSKPLTTDVEFYLVTAVAD